MNDQNFALTPFAPAGLRPNLEITGQIARRGRTIAIHYELRGRWSEVIMDPPAPLPARRQGLWQETCFEFFLALQGAPQYWEFNLSPAGHWNVYHFAGYRQGMAEEPAFTSLPFDVRSRPEVWWLALEVDLAEIVPADRVLEVAIAAVIRARGGEASYWALSHGGPQADFHRRDGFNLVL